MPASAMILEIFRWAVARDQSQRGLAATLAGAERSAWTSSFEGAEQLGRDGNLAPALGAALQGLDPDRGGLEVVVPGANGQGFGDPGGGLEEAPAFIGSEVLAAAGVDELEIADQARHFA